MADGGANRCWRMGLAARIGTGMAFLAIVLGALIDAVNNGSPLTDPVPLIPLFAALWWIGTMRPAVCFTSDELVVRNPLWTRRIARENVVSAKAGSFGIVIRRRVGRPCIGWALQKPRIDEWTGRRTRTDDAANTITHWAQASPSSVQRTCN